ncbi:RidA family protein [Campylobacter pinnipediorum]|uniref:Reactive intermediate/imine deaminase n=1 Tax=Campylobacter pinnipediorum subsp. pinnipediorum TaxID=1660067 RepID=A0AAX0LE68_9BACT|nr:RidA family protein [Campylobacter pinnipediorum]AQW82051.1 reactive intermediate/imine deaminase [Campylobacter pinnipediorum subsp. pinnipediorum]AQW83729.1 reactive intermediate/imine deaminase [Campylobacter pinnipediorum subsp. pinnipediorum]AQW85248.1 reactive intermediate/imine deaminase [Campylobacter pinnipediorum subsp. pinnipediorum]OPA82127.1 reactive intermediate/imine deaminase [Campylobacter pinnipediorum subsp. pinnipediorum]
MKQIIHTNLAPQAIGPYSQAVLVNGMLFISGQLGVKPNGEFAGVSVEEQAKQSLENIKNILAEAKMDFKNVVKTTIFLANIEDFSKVNDIYATYFDGDYPARSTIAVKTLPKNGLVEIETIAAL